MNAGPTPDTASIEVYESPELRATTMPNLFQAPMLETFEVELSNIYTMPYVTVMLFFFSYSHSCKRSESNHDNYMVLYNGNAEVIGNFRALNFYKASDINIKEDVRLLMEGKCEK
jgi:hypothetical protein